MDNNTSLIKSPIEDELKNFQKTFEASLSGNVGLLDSVLQHILNQGGKRMRPILTLLMAKVYYHKSLKSKVLTIAKKRNPFRKTYLAATALELLHTASLVHDDVVDESNERRGQASVNAQYNNKIAVLVGDFILSTSLSIIANTGDVKMVAAIANLGKELSDGEVKQIENIGNQEISEDAYFDVISKKTASLFECCCYMGARSVKATKTDVAEACEFGRKLGLIFQIRDDIFDYFDSKEIGKPTGNDMLEGKLTLPVIHVLNKTQDAAMMALAQKVKSLTATKEEIKQLVDFTKQNGGIDYAKAVMVNLRLECIDWLLINVASEELRSALMSYVDYVIGREF